MNAPVGILRPATGQAKVRCREIGTADLPAVLDLLSEGFPRRSRAYWSRGLQRLADRKSVPDHPRFGFLIEAGTDIVGCLLLIVSEQSIDGRKIRRANVSSWFVRPAYRFQASMLVSVAFRQKDVTFINISPAPHTVPILLAQGYRQYVAGQAIMAPALSRHGHGARIARISPDDDRFRNIVPEMDLLRRHAGLDCIVVVAIDGMRHEPFIFVRRRIIRSIVPAAQLIWCRDISAFSRYAGALGRYLLLRHGIVSVSCDCDGVRPAVPGVHREGNGRKFYRGEHRPRLGDLADTELVVFGA